MPTEAQVLAIISENWPTLTAIIGGGSVYAALYLQLKSFLDRLKRLEEELVKQRKEWLSVKRKVAQIAMIHCIKYPADQDRLMREDDE